MKIAIITDMHFGVRGDSGLFLNNQEKFFTEIFFPYLDEHGIKTVLNLGDTFDRRKFINFVTLGRVRKFYFDELAKRGIEYHSVVGNHDTSYKNTNEVNALTLLCQEYPQFYAYTHEPVELQFGSTKFMLSPWLTKENEEVSFRAFRDTRADILAGHFEFTGFEMMKGTLCDHGLDRVKFSKFSDVWSGHFHHPSKYGNIEYLGAPYEMTWTDFNGVRGFHVFDTESRNLQRIINDNRMFHKIHYDDFNLKIEEINDLDPSVLKDTYIKVIVNVKNNPYLFDLFINKLQSADPADLKIVEDTLNLEGVTEEELIAEQKDTRTALYEFVDGLENVVDINTKTRIKAVLDSLYAEAMAL